MAPAPRAVKRIPGAGRFYDWRGTSLCPSSGVRINPALMVEHIPVIRNAPGPKDFITLANVLRAQGLHLQAATDAEGNVALYSNLNEMCWQARGANQVSCGVEHMHWSVHEPWTRAQLNASAWLWQRAEATHGIPMRWGKLGAGHGVVRVRSAGHVAHSEVSAAAGFFDRSDPGPLYDREYVAKAARYFKRKRTFKGF